MPNARSAIGEARLEKEQALARLRQLQGRGARRPPAGPRTGPAFAALRDRALGMEDRIVARGAERPAAELRAIVDSEVCDLLRQRLAEMLEVEIVGWAATQLRA